MAQLKLMVGSVRVKARAVKSMLLKYSPPKAGAGAAASAG